MQTFRLLVVISGMVLLPGWAFLALTNLWRRWEGLEHWFVAIGLSISFYPIFFYYLRFFSSDIDAWSIQIRSDVIRLLAHYFMAFVESLARNHLVQISRIGCVGNSRDDDFLSFVGDS